ncbi:MAG: protocatechuate 3,4-dioxygenase subunit alpha [Burkholderiales bacterium]
MSLRASTSQTIGPYLRIGLEWMQIEDLAARGASGERIAIRGRVIDGDGEPVNDAAVEIWQANSHGRYASPEDRQEKPLESGFRGYGRSLTDDQGAFRFSTVKPGRLPGPGGSVQAPHLNVTIFMRGLLKQLMTRMYFAEDPGNASDPVLALVPAERRATLIARKGSDGTLEWNVVLQGRDETVFFDF